jgi:short-subunit dehydrogenase
MSGSPLLPEKMTLAVQSFHWSFSIGAAAIYGAVVEVFPKAQIGWGLGFGMVLLLLTHETTLPFFGFSLPWSQIPLTEHLSEIFTHALYGVSVELIRHTARPFLNSCLSSTLDPCGTVKSKLFQGQVVVVTGASAGVGRAVVRAFARDVADVALIARGVDGLEAAAKEVRAYGGRALVLPLDIADAAAASSGGPNRKGIGANFDLGQRCHGFCLFAGKGDEGRRVQRVTEVTYLGFVYGTLAALKHMLPRNRGRIIQVGSSLAYRGIPLQSAYCASKHAIQGFMDSLRCELLHDKSAVTVTMVRMPALSTPQFGWVNRAQLAIPSPCLPFFSRK